MKNILILLILVVSFFTIKAQTNLIIVDGEEIKTKGPMSVLTTAVRFNYAKGGKGKIKARDIRTLELYDKKGNYKEYQTFRTEDIPGLPRFGREFVFLKVNRKKCYTMYFYDVPNSGSNWYNTPEDSTLTFYWRKKSGPILDSLQCDENNND